MDITFDTASAHDDDYLNADNYKKLSYSSLLLLHSCPRKYQLYKLKARKSIEDNAYQSLTFAFGHAVGLGVQLALCSTPIDTIYWEVFKSFTVDILLENTKQQKSFWLAMIAIEKFSALLEQGLLENTEVVQYNNQSAVELGFSINIVNGYTLRGSIDAVLRNTQTGAIFVTEVKTTSGNYVTEAQYKNSSQGLGYCLVLDSVCPGYSSYDVIYPVYKTKTKDWEVFVFTKSIELRSRYIRELMLDVETIALYEKENLYPMHGESCFNYYRECEYLGICHMKTEHLVGTQLDNTSETQFSLKLDLLDIIDSQFIK